jgi:hypothetical protein
LSYFSYTALREAKKSWFSNELRLGCEFRLQQGAN